MALGHPVPTNEGWLDLAALKNLYSCEIIGWAINVRTTKKLVTDTVRAAYWRKETTTLLGSKQRCAAQFRIVIIFDS